MEDDFYGTIKFKNGEEIFAKVAASEEENRTMLILHHPVIVSEVRSKNKIVGYKVEPWLKTTTEDMYIINLNDVLTLSESSDIEMIMMHQRFLRDCQASQTNRAQISRRMGYIANVSDAKAVLEKLYKKDIKS